MLWVRIPRLATGRWFSSGTPVASTNWPPRYNWNIVESGVKHLKTNQPTLKKDILRSYFSIERLIILNCWEHICVQYTITYMTAKTISFLMVNFPFFMGTFPWLHHIALTVPSQGHYGFHSFPVVDWFCLFIYVWVLTFPL